MGRAGVYRTDVEKARRALLAQGKNPSIDLVRAQLGNTGSRSTIHRLLKEIEAEEAEPQGSKLAVSDALQDLVAKLSERLHEEATTLVAEHKELADAKLRAQAELVEEARKEAAGLRQALQASQTALDTAVSAHQAITARLQESAIRTAQQDERLAGLERRAHEQDTHLESLEEKHQQAREALEHFRTAAHEQRAREQRQHEQALHALQVELRQAAEQLTAKNAELVRLNRDNGRLLEQTAHLQQALRLAEQKRELAEQELTTLRPIPEQLERQQSRLAETLAQRDALQAAIATAERGLADAHTDLRAVELDKVRLAARLEGIEAAMAAQSDPSKSKTKSKRASHSEPSSPELPLADAPQSVAND